jgi:hypothetical protein
VLAPAERGGGTAALVRTADRVGLVWSERLGARHTLRFLVVDHAAEPVSPSVEVVDAAAPLAAPSIEARPGGAGYRVSWSEGEQRRARDLDERGRPRSDVLPVDAAAPSAAATRCAGSRCAAPAGKTLELPPAARVIAEWSDDGLPAVIAQDERVLRLWSLDCAAR